MHGSARRHGREGDDRRRYSSWRDRLAAYYNQQTHDTKSSQHKRKYSGESGKVSAIQIRAATAGDSATIKRMVWHEHLDPTMLRWEHFLVAEDERRIVGIGQIREYGGCQELGSLVVLPAYRGQGIAAQLITALETRAGRPLYLFCRECMANYYARFGYQRIGYWDAPKPIKLKMLMPLAIHILGVKVIVMRKG
jgi:amino-acid N-acetyltransferase